MNRNNHTCIIGIDPDVDKSGVAVLNRHTRELTTYRHPFPELLDCLRAAQCAAKESGHSLVVVVEAGWLNRSNWHTAGKSTRISTAIGNATGRNHEVARKIVEMCRHYGIDTIEQKPLRKMWSGPDGKITHAELAAFTQLKGRTNQEERDAALMAWCYAELPIIIRPKPVKQIT